MSRRGKLTSAFGQSDLSVLSKNALPAIPPELLIAEDEIDWSSVHEIGKGANGSVYKAKYKSNEIAIKIFHLDNVELPQNQKMIINAALEVAIELEPSFENPGRPAGWVGKNDQPGSNRLDFGNL